MPTECNPELFGFAPVEGREVVAAFDAGAITSDAGALLLGATDRAIGMMHRFASCFHDLRCPEFIEHQVVTLVGQRDRLGPDRRNAEASAPSVSCRR